MQILKTPQALKKFVRSLKGRKKTSGFVPTMGALHEGHLSLVRASKKENDVTIASIFVNPLQFGPKEDLKRYPRNLERDQKLLRQAGADALFAPDVNDLYSPEFQTTVSLSRLSLPLCGKTRPGHFPGVATVVMKLLNLTLPDRLYLGQKDHQQCRVIEQMIKDMDIPVAVRRAPIVREKDGLAMSSRNIYLSPEDRRQAVVLSRALSRAANFIRSGKRNTSKIKKEVLSVLKSAPHARVDYAEIVDARTLGDVVKLRKGSQVVVALAVYFGKTRLIDNTLADVR